MKDNRREMLALAARLGVALSTDDDQIKLLRLDHVKVVDLLPEMLIMIRSLVASETFSYRRKPIEVIRKGLLISFQNGFDTGEKERTPAGRPLAYQPHVRITPSYLESEVLFPKDINIRQITILIELEYLKQFIGKEQDRLNYLFDVEKTFWIEEFMSPEMAALVNELADTESNIILSQAYYRLKALELIYLLFRNTLNREDIEHQNLSNNEIDAVYLVRNAIEASLEKPFVKDELIKLSGMNELKLRNIFTQVFGMGLYAYYNHLRMEEAARLLKEEHLSVSEAGYHLGFSNLSYFGRLFEKHFGLKPKKWSIRQHKNNMSSD